MEVPTFTGDKFLALAQAGKLPADQREALRMHVIIDHELVPGAPEFTDLCLAHLQAMEAGNRYVSALVAHHLPSRDVT